MRSHFAWLLILLGLLLSWPLNHSVAAPSVVLVLGAPGSDEFGERFRGWMESWREAAEQGGAEFVAIGVDQKETPQDRRDLLEALKEQRSDAADPLWLVLIGHGTFDGKIAKFNLRGPDISAQELANHLRSFRRPLAIINCASASAPFVNHLSGENRVVVTATKSGFQYNYARFGEYLASAISDPQADLDKDEQTSLLEALLMASSRVGEFYESEGRLATEDAMVDDNGDGLGTLASWFRGVRTTRTPKDDAPADGLRANQFFLLRSDAEEKLTPEQRQRRDALEAELERLRAGKKKLSSDEYYGKLEQIFVEMATLYEGDEP